MYPLLTLLLACCFCCDSAIVGEENHEDCFASDSVLKCDFIESTQVCHFELTFARNVPGRGARGVTSILYLRETLLHCYKLYYVLYTYR